MNKLSTQHRWILVGVAIVLVNVAVWYFGISPSLDRLETVKAEHASAEQQLVRLEQRLEELNAIDVEALQREMAELNLQLPELGMLREWLVEVEQLAGQLGLKLDTISAHPPREEGSYLFLDMSITLAGSYSGLYSFIDYMESHERLVLVRSFGFRESNDGVSTTILIGLYAEDFYDYTPHTAPGRNDPFR